MKFQLITLAALVAPIFAHSLPRTALAAREATSLDLVERRAEIMARAGEVEFDDETQGSLAYIFNAIDSIPDDVLAAGDDATNKWLVDHGYRSNSTAGVKRDEDHASVWERAPEPQPEEGLDSVELAKRVNWWKVAKCVGAIVQLLATTAVPAAKLLRIKKYINALGGAKQAVQLLLKATSRAEKLKAGGEVLVNLAAELSGISSVQKACF